MARLSRKLRVCKWIDTLGCVLILGACVGSGWCSLGYARDIGRDVGLVMVSNGSICLAWLPGEAPTDIGWVLMGNSSEDMWPFDFEWLPACWSSTLGRKGVDIPLWIPFLLPFIPTLLLWRRDRRRFHPGFCRQCDYDLTGNTSGRSPECGLKIAA